MSDNAKRKPIKAPIKRFEQQPRQQKGSFNAAMSWKGKRTFTEKPRNRKQ